MWDVFIYGITEITEMVNKHTVLALTNTFFKYIFQVNILIDKLTFDLP